MTAVRHRPRIERPMDEETGKPGHRMRCTCGASGQVQASRASAAWDQREHIKALPKVPAAQQCRTPRIHGRKYWESCDLCGGQLPLFEVKAS